jgi:hypothetical protein
MIGKWHIDCFLYCPLNLDRIEGCQMKPRVYCRFFAVSSLLLVASTVGAQHPVAGLAPDQRPDGAPVITEYHKDGDWYSRALVGIERPFPASLRFLEDQGAWYTPFIRPGMTGRYDIRHWH